MARHKARTPPLQNVSNHIPQSPFAPATFFDPSDQFATPLESLAQPGHHFSNMAVYAPEQHTLAPDQAPSIHFATLAGAQDVGNVAQPSTPPNPISSATHVDHAVHTGHHFANIAIHAPPQHGSATVQLRYDQASENPIPDIRSATANRTGLPSALKARAEQLSGYALDDVRVHYQSAKPAQLQALAYTQGPEIHIASGQEQHLPHEVWHVVQQMQGRVAPTLQMQGVQVNADAGLEREADVQGSKLQAQPSSMRFVAGSLAQAHFASAIVQRKIGEQGDNQWVVEKKTRKIFLAKINTVGSYDLFGRGLKGDYNYEKSVEKDDPGYDLSDQQDDEYEDERIDDDGFDKDSNNDEEMDDMVENDEKYDGDEEMDVERTYKFQIKKSGRRIVTSFPDDKDMKVFLPRKHDKKFGKKKKEEDDEEGNVDFSYPEMSRAFYQAIDEDDRSSMDKSVEVGANLPLEQEDIEVSSKYNVDLQLIPHHILRYQYANTPPTLKSQARQNENVWRREELNFTKNALSSLGVSGLQRILPEMGKKDNKQSQVRNVFPGLLDVGFAPDEDKTLFTYVNNKSVFKLNKDIRLDAFNRVQKGGRPRSSLTKAYLRKLKSQDDSTIDDPQRYVKNVLGIKPKVTEDDRDLSFDEDSSDDEQSKDIDKSVYNPNDNLVTAYNKRKSYLNTIGLQIKILNRKILEDHVDMQKAENNGDEVLLRNTKVRLRKHKSLLSKMERKHQLYHSRLGKKFKSIDKQRENYVKKKALLKKFKKKYSKNQVYQEYNDEIRDYGKRLSVRKLEKRKDLMYRVGEKTLKRRFEESEEEKKKPNKRRRKK